MSPAHILLSALACSSIRRLKAGSLQVSYRWL